MRVVVLHTLNITATKPLMLPLDELDIMFRRKSGFSLQRIGTRHRVGPISEGRRRKDHTRPISRISDGEANHSDMESVIITTGRKSARQPRSARITCSKRVILTSGV